MSKATGLSFSLVCPCPPENQTHLGMTRPQGASSVMDNPLVSNKCCFLETYCFSGHRPRSIDQRGAIALFRLRTAPE